jgi:hypothetical protein
VGEGALVGLTDNPGFLELFYEFSMLVSNKQVPNYHISVAINLTWWRNKKNNADMKKR